MRRPGQILLLGLLALPLVLAGFYLLNQRADQRWAKQAESQQQHSAPVAEASPLAAPPAQDLPVDAPPPRTPLSAPRRAQPADSPTPAERDALAAEARAQPKARRSPRSPQAVPSPPELDLDALEEAPSPNELEIALLVEEALNLESYLYLSNNQNFTELMRLYDEQLVDDVVAANNTLAYEQRFAEQMEAMEANEGMHLTITCGSVTCLGSLRTANALQNRVLMGGIAPLYSNFQRGLPMPDGSYLNRFLFSINPQYRDIVKIAASDGSG